MANNYFYGQQVLESLRQNRALQAQADKEKKAQEVNWLGPLLGAISGYASGGGPQGAGSGTSLLLGALKGLGATQATGVAGLANAGIGGYTAGQDVQASIKVQQDDLAKRTAEKAIMDAATSGPEAMKKAIEANLINAPDSMQKAFAESLYPKQQTFDPMSMLVMKQLFPKMDLSSLGQNQSSQPDIKQVITELQKTGTSPTEIINALLK